MPKLRLYLPMLGLLFFCLCTLGFASNKTFDTMIIFGDSLSDTGNLYHFMWDKLPASPPYFDGRFSNGSLWIEQVYDSYYPDKNYNEGFQNYAVGGAGAVFSLKASLPFTLAIELGNYLYWNTYPKKESNLYVIWIGANNYVNGPLNVDTITTDVVDAIGETIEKLIVLGGNKFFIPNLPDLSRMPQSVDLHIEGLIHELVITHNRKLNAKIKQLQAQYPSVTLVYFDIYSFFDDAITHPQDYGFTNISDPCYLGSYIGWAKKYMPDDETLFAYLKEQDARFDAMRWTMIKNNPILKEAVIGAYLSQLFPDKLKPEPSLCDQYVFWDHLHPSHQAHYYIALKAREALDAAGLEAVSPGAFNTY